MLSETVVMAAYETGHISFLQTAYCSFIGISVFTHCCLILSLCLLQLGRENDLHKSSVMVTAGANQVRHYSFNVLS